MAGKGGTRIEDTLRDELGMDPDVERTMIIPNPNGSFDPRKWTAPQWLYDTAKAVMLPGHVAQGGDWSPDDANDMAMTIAGGGFGATAPVGSLTSGAALRTRGALNAVKKGARKSTLPAEERATRGFSLDKRPVDDPVDQHWRLNKQTKEYELHDGPAYPRIWESPRTLASEAAEAVAPEDEALKSLFGVTRDDLFEMSKRKGNMPGQIKQSANPRGSETANAIMTPRNTQRMQDQIAEAQRFPDLYKGMHAWYTMDPAYQRLVEMVGPEEAARRYIRWNTLTSMASPGSDVLTEIERGSGANMLAAKGRFDDFDRYAGIKEKLRGADFPEDLVGISAHPYHRTSQALPMRAYIDTGEVQMQSPKVPLYMQASRVPEIGFQTDSAVPDAHFTRNVGMADVRRGKGGGPSMNPGASMRTPEYGPVRDWWRNDVTAPMGIEAVPGQAIVWGVGSRATGVDSPIGAPKLELLSQHIMQRAKETGLPPDLVRDKILMGEMRAKGGRVKVKRGALNKVRRNRAA